MMLIIDLVFYMKPYLTIQMEAKRCYEYILFNLENSIHLVESRKRYRNLRPDI